MRILLIRHGEREHKQGSDSQMSLTPDGRGQVEQLRSDIARLDLHPTLILTSQHAHARETANILASAGEGDSESSVISLKALTSPAKDEPPPRPATSSRSPMRPSQPTRICGTLVRWPLSATNRTLGRWSHA